VGSGAFRFLASNRAAEALLPGLCALSPSAIVDLWFGPGLFRQLVENWRDVVWAGVPALRREAARASDPALAELLRRAEGHVKAIPPPELDAHPELPVVCPRLNIRGRSVRTISTVMRFDTASELRVELMYPPPTASAKRTSRSELPIRSLETLQGLGVADHRRSFPREHEMMSASSRSRGTR
jgi:hypothetical protein